MFLDALGRAATADELKDIQDNARMLEHAGFAVEDASNAPFIAPWAWMWAREVREKNSRTEVQQRIMAAESTLGDFIAKLEPRTFALSIAKAMPPIVLSHQIDSGFLKAALRDSLSFLWIWLATFCIAGSGYLGWRLGARHDAELEAMVSEKSQQLAHEQLINEHLLAAGSKH